MGNTRLAALWAACTIILSACGGSSGSGSALAPPPPPPPPVEPTIAVQAVFPKLSFSQPVSLQQAPGDSAIWYVVEQAGRILAFANDQGASATVPFLDIGDRVVAGGERGLLGLAFDPDFPTVEDVFVSYTGSGQGGALVSVLSRFSLLPDGSALDAASEQVILTVPQEFTNHNGRENNQRS